MKKPVPIEFYPKAMSFSAYENFNTCAYSYYRQRIVKDIPYVEGKEAAFGNVVHSAIERAIKEHRLIGAETYIDPETQKEVTNDLSWLNQYFAPFLRMREQGWTLWAEKEIVFTKPPFQKSDWCKGWWRTKSDVVLLNPEKTIAVYLDWKTGGRKARSVSKYQKQMRYAALAMLIEFADVQTVNTSLCWTKEAGKIDALAFTRADIQKLLEEFASDVNDMAYAHQQNSWPKKKGGLCRKYCSVKDCENYTEE